MNKRPQMDYPCKWTYTIIGSDPNLMRTAVGSIIQPGTYTVDESRISRTGKYMSLSVQLVVFSQEERDRYFGKLGNHKDIKMVL
ncbi:MAG: DUF493 domain-containing protein [Chitinispirillaceae bacterium]